MSKKDGKKGIDEGDEMESRRVRRRGEVGDGGGKSKVKAWSHDVDANVAWA